VDIRDVPFALCAGSGGAPILVRQADRASVSALAWDSTGQTLAFGTEAGEAGALSF